MNKTSDAFEYDEIRRKHLLSIEKGDYNVRSGLIYTELFTACEQLTNHLSNVHSSIAGEV